MAIVNTLKFVPNLKHMYTNNDYGVIGHCTNVTMAVPLMRKRGMSRVIVTSITLGTK